MSQKSKPEPGAAMAKAKGKPIKPIGPQRPIRPQGQKDEQGRYGFSKGGAANMVAQAMEVQKPN